MKNMFYISKQFNHFLKFCPMKKLVFFLMLSVLSINQLIAQSTEDLVTNIRRQYNEVSSMESNRQSTGCQTGSKTINKVIGGTNMRYPQSTKKCNYPGGYTIITSKFEDWELDATVKFYIRNGQLLFVYTDYTNVVSRYEHRTYYSNNRVIRILEKDILDSRGNVTTRGESRDITYSNEGNWVKNFNSERLRQSSSMLK
jgi:outer membrane lipoprotein-sorting protein